ncbi:MAG: thiamine-phosphate kinase [Deltaproteobacteria bacterium]|nr:thiamine-phosphate kinase [Deltaproteobacteria bacterium]
MHIQALGGEFKLLDRILRRKGHAALLVNNGDDGAVIRVGSELLAVSVDAFVSERHFSFRYGTPEQVGFKSIEGSASDIVAMGGRPEFIFVSIVIPAQTPVERIDSLYAGMYESCDRIGAVLAGGDTTSGSEQLVISVSVLGRIASQDCVSTRSGAKPGDLIFSSGPLGGSACGLALLQRGIPDFSAVKAKHLKPTCRIDIIDAIAPIATSMIDVSDGLSSELHHVARSSGCAALLRKELIPLTSEVRQAAKLLNLDPYALALNGGEDFELLYTVSPQHREAAIGTEIGVMLPGQGVRIEEEGRLLPLVAAGFNHF